MVIVASMSLYGRTRRDEMIDGTLSCHNIDNDIDCWSVTMCSMSPGSEVYYYAFIHFFGPIDHVDGFDL